MQVVTLECNGEEYEFALPLDSSTIAACFALNPDICLLLDGKIVVSPTAVVAGKKYQVKGSSSSIKTPTLSLSPIKRELAMINDKVERAIRTTVSATPSTQAERYKQLFKKTVQPWFPKGKIPFLKEKKKSNPVFSVDTPPYNASEKGTVQPWWTNILEKGYLGTNTPIELSDEHKHETIGRRKPDLIGWIRDSPHNPFYIVIVGELKGCRSEKSIHEFSNEEKGQLESFLEDLSQYQQHRHQFTGFLSDGRIIQFFQLQIDTNGFKTFCETPVYSLQKQGGEFLMGLLETSPDKLGMQTKLFYSKEEIQINRVLGVGGSSIVYAGTTPTISGEFVVKHFQPNYLSRLNIEKQNLMTLNDVENVTHVIGETDDKSALLVTPIGEPFAISEIDYKLNKKNIATADDYTVLVNILQLVHKKKKLVHRDITLSNMFKFKGKVLLNDWGCATEINKQTSFSGSLIFAPDHILKLIHQFSSLDINYTPQPADDLEMIVKCLYSRLNPTFLTILQIGDLSKDVRLLLTFWQRELSPTIWQNLLKFARKTEYESFCGVIRDLLA